VFLDLLARRFQPGGIEPVAGANRVSVGIILTNFQIGEEMNSTGVADEDCPAEWGKGKTVPASQWQGKNTGR